MVCEVNDGGLSAFLVESVFMYPSVGNRNATGRADLGQDWAGGSASGLVTESGNGADSKSRRCRAGVAASADRLVIARSPRSVQIDHSGRRRARLRPARYVQ